MKLKNKKGLEAEVLIGIIITVLVAAVIFWFLYLHNIRTTEFIDREACHQSVLMRSIPTVIGTPFRTGLPLKCKTEKILITQEDEELIKNRIANAMHDCWWMLGEGKLNFFATGFVRKNYCLICSTIGFDEDAKNKKIDNFQDYLAKEKIPLTNLTYLQYISNSAADNPEIAGIKESMNTNKEYAVVFSFFKGEMLTNILMGGTGGVIGAKAGAIIGSIVPGPGTVVGATTGLVIGSAIGLLAQSQWKNFISGSEKDYFASLYLIEYNKADLKEMGCTDIESIP